MYRLIHIAPAFLLLTGTRATTHTVTINYGYWNLTIVGGASATGYRWQDTTASHSSSREQLTKCHWLYSPEFRNETLTCSDPSFSYEWGYNRNTITIQQTLPLEIDGKVQNVTLGGTADITLSYGGVNGRGFEGKTIVEAKKCCVGRGQGTSSLS
ncbi:hypothetical protein QBC35DRAFT_436055 [Podospora australis]|uniref:AA1-like domain-containing protein n=1 Tax=Podospora australis TaxID=1536484 RepID=A0AAN7AHQ1_9PEZI|nr:hypothetical protein QBC35DRAFT_436055 [Podospora australis]